VQDRLRVPDDELDYDSDLVYFYKGARFTGVGYEDKPGLGRSEISYSDGWQEGPARDWYPDGTLKAETWYMESVKHGPDRSYAPDGRLYQERYFEYGIPVATTTFDTDGQPLNRTEITPDDDRFELLQKFRSQKKWPKIAPEHR
jgi:antitoxin component YwqK of YwqJK toxin-antitoxin module